MASYSGLTSVTATLTAATVDTVTLTEPFSKVTVLNESSTGAISVTVDGTTPTAGGNNTYNVGPNGSVVIQFYPRLQGESSEVNGVAAPTWSYAADGTPVPSAWVTTLSGSKFSNGVDTNNVLTLSAPITSAVIKLISAATPTYTVQGG